jgi:hypothetical protein
MAGNLPVPGGVEVKLTWTLNGTPSALNILHYLQSPVTPMTQARADAISTIHKGAFSGSLHAGSIYTGVSLATVSVRDMASNTNPWYIGAGAGAPGTAAGNPLPAATALVISLPTGFRGRSYNGRIYLWGFTEDANDAAGGVTAGAGANAVAFISQCTTSMSSTQQCNIGVLSRFTTPPGGTGTIERTPPIISVASGVILRDQRWDVQRRRATPGI